MHTHTHTHNNDNNKTKENKGENKKSLLLLLCATDPPSLAVVTELVKSSHLARQNRQIHTHERQKSLAQQLVSPKRVCVCVWRGGFPSFMGFRTLIFTHYKKKEQEKRKKMGVVCAANIKERKEKKRVHVATHINRKKKQSTV